MTTETVKERRRRIAKEYYNARKNDPEFLAMRAKRSADRRKTHPEVEKNKQQRLEAQKRYYDKIKDTPEFKAKHAVQTKKYRDKMRNDPVWREKQRASARRHLEKKKRLNEQATTTDSLDSRTSEL